MDTKDIENLLMIANYLKDGKDPMTGLIFEKDTILNSPAIKAYNKNIANLLKALYPNLTKKQNFKIPHNELFLSPSSISNFKYCTDSISISYLCKNINSLRNPKFPQLRAAKVTEWLCLHGFLTEIKKTDSQSHREPTNKGMEIGIKSEERKSNSGLCYYVNLYSSNAQKYIVCHINEIVSWAFE